MTRYQCPISDPINRQRKRVRSISQKLKNIQIHKDSTVRVRKSKSRIKMTLRLTNNRSRSASDILDGMANSKEKFETNYFAENRYRTYTLKGFKEEKKRFMKKEQSPPKSTQNFVKKLIASLEKKNKVCKADDEFFAKYYSRNCPEKNFKSVLDNINCVNETLLEDLSRNKNEYKKNDQRSYRNRYHTFQSIYESNGRKEFDTSEEYEEKKYGFSSFDPNRPRVSKKSEDDGRRNVESKYSKSKKKENGKTTFVRNRSFKDFFGSIIKWRRSENKKKPQRFVSCNHLIEQSRNFNYRNGKILSRSSSSLQDTDIRNIVRNEERRATIHPVYGGKRNDHLLEILSERREDHLETNKNTEHLVKPSAIKDIIKRVSQFPDKSLINN